jgi:hypothetical protein
MRRFIVAFLRREFGAEGFIKILGLSGTHPYGSTTS